MKTISRMMLAAAATSMAVLPAAAEANTRASSKATAYASVSAPGKGRAAKGQRQSEDGGVSGIVLGVIATGLIVGGIVVLATSDDDGQSPGV